MDFNKSVEELKTSPIFAMSLGSKELFHSNFWAWILENADINHDFLHLFFPNINEYNMTIEREEGNRDITIWIENNEEKYAYVIENKYKSIPSKEQLEKYEEDIKRKTNFVEGVLTGVDEPEFAMPEGWKFVNYSEIATTINKIANNTNIDDKRKQYLIDYSRMLGNLDEILKTYKAYFNDSLPCFDNNNPKYDKDLDNEVKNLRLSDLCQKHQEYLFMKKISVEEDYKKLCRKAKDNNMELFSGCGFSHGHYSLTIRVIKNKGTKKQKHLGVQIEGHQYRITAEKLFPKKPSDVEKEKIFNDSDFKNWFVDIENNPNWGNRYGVFKGSSMSDRYCSYCGQSSVKESKKVLFYAFVYQYWNLNYEINIYEELHKIIMQDLNKAFDILSKEN